MKFDRQIGRRLARMVTGFVVLPAFMGMFSLLSAAAPAGETVRPEVGKPLQAAQELIKEKKYKDALAKLQDAEKVPNITPFESFLINRIKGVAAASAGETELAAKSFEAVIDSGKMPPAESLKLEEAIAGMAYQGKNYQKSITWAQRFFKDGGADPQMRTLLSQSYYLSGDYTKAAKELLSDIQADEAAGRSPAEDRLQLLASCYLKQGDQTGYINALEKLVTYYPKKDYWADLLHRVQTKPGFADRLVLDVYRLRLHIGMVNTAADYMEAAQLALQEGLPEEGKKIVDQGFAGGVLGTGPEADRHKRLKDLAYKSAAADEKVLAGDAAAGAKDANALVNVGFAYASAGQYDKGIALMEQGIQKGGLSKPEDAKLHLGLAYFWANQKPKAVQTWKTVAGTDGTADLARLWAIEARH